MKERLKKLHAQIIGSPRNLLFLCVLLLTAYLAFVLASGSAPVFTIVAYVLLVLFLALFIFLCLNPDAVRSQHTEETLSVVSGMLEDIKGGLTRESADEICKRILPETRANSVAITDQFAVLAIEGEHAKRFPPGSPIHMTVTHYVLEHGIVQSFNNVEDMDYNSGDSVKVPAVIIAPIKVGERTIGTLKFYFSDTRDVDRTQYAMAEGFAEVLSTQLNIHELELQKELTARAELRALQAQINPHFLFNTLNTIASFTRTDPARARTLLREFSSFYRVTLENSGSLIPMEREIAQTKRYLVFEKARFGEDRIADSFTIEPGLETTPVPAFVVQPLVENAVRHAMRDEGPLHIDVSVYREGENWVTVCVKDDGLGMEEEVAHRLFRNDTEQPDFNAPQGGGAGVAMRNIYERITRFFGPESFAHVESTPNVGTSVFLHLELLGSNALEE